MSSIRNRWAELASQHERVARAGDAAAGPGAGRWAELASHGERLAGAADAPGLPAGRRGAPDMRLVAARG